ncbi:MAG: hypothetical protein AAFY45_30640 [Bacteroidota bacterium]
MRKSIQQNLKQLLLIVFSVVLGIFLSERIEERKKEREAALLLSKLKSEINDNKKLLEYWVPYHIEIVHRLDSLNKNEQFVRDFINDPSYLYNAVLTRGNLMSDSPSNDAWEIAKSHPLVVHFDYEDLLILSKIYNQQEGTYQSVPKLIELFLSADFNARGKAKQNLQSFRNQMREITSREVQLMNYFKEADTILKLKDS